MQFLVISAFIFIFFACSFPASSKVYLCTIYLQNVGVGTIIFENNMCVSSVIFLNFVISYLIFPNFWSAYREIVRVILSLINNVKVWYFFPQM